MRGVASGTVNNQGMTKYHGFSSIFLQRKRICNEEKLNLKILREIFMAVER